MTTAAGTTREFVLVEARGDLSPVIRSIEKDKAFEKRPVSGLPVWLRRDLAVARVGPKTLAVGAVPEVEELVRVRLGIKPDLKITGQLFDRFQALNQGSAVRLISRDPPKLTQMFQPVFATELLDAAQLLGLSLTLQNPIKARLFLKLKSTQDAAEFVRSLRSEPQRWLRIQNSELALFRQTPEIEAQGNDLQIRFDVPENSARLILQRIAKTNATAPLVAHD
jgi:hypothetical protein